MNHENQSPAFLVTNLAGAPATDPNSGRLSGFADASTLKLQLTYPEGCQASCSYCGLQTNGPAISATPGQTGPIYSVDEIIARLKENPGDLERVCLSMPVHPNAAADTACLVERLCKETGLKAAALINPLAINDGDIEALYDAGADRAIVAMETATRDLFDEHRSTDKPHQWDQIWQILGDTVAFFGGDRTGTHFIAGLGETEAQMVNTIQRVRNLGVSTHLFSFLPHSRSHMKQFAPCSAGQFRRIQLARFLIDCSLVVASQMEFDEYGRITGFGLRGTELDDIVDTGEPFTASGCPGKTKNCACNRPCVDGSMAESGGYSYSLEPENILQARKQMATYMESPGYIDRATI